jgi:hypothetical protein
VRTLGALINEMNVAHNNIDDVILELRATEAPSPLKIRSPEAINDVARLAQTIARNAPQSWGLRTLRHIGAQGGGRKGRGHQCDHSNLSGL